MDDAGLVEVVDRLHDAGPTVVVGMAAAAGQHVQAQPFEVIQQGGLGGHVGAATGALGVGAVEIAVDAGLEVAEAGVGFVEQLAEPQVFRFAEDGQAAREQDVAGEGDGEPAGFGFVGQGDFVIPSEARNPLSWGADSWPAAQNDKKRASDAILPSPAGCIGAR
ncbi:MAG TPA: hypothetical protein VIR57_18880 [Chloroflexota bacterium]